MAIVKLVEICEKIGSGATPCGGKEAYCKEGISLVRSQNILDFYFLKDGLAFINDEQARKLSNVEVNSGDVLLNITGDSVARACLMNGDYLPARVNQHVAIIRGKANRVLNSYILYYLQWRKDYLLQLASAGATRNALTKTMIEQLELDLPPLDNQKRVVAILDSLQSRIQLNQKINDNLQQQARALYKSWFVDFEPFGKQMPDSWKIGKLKDVLYLRKEVLKAGERKDLRYLPIDTIPMNTFTLTATRPNEEAQSSLLAFHRDDIIIGAMRVYFHRVIIAPFNGITRSTCFVLTPKDPNYLAFGLLCCDQDKSIDFAQQSSKGSTMPYAVWDGGLGELEIAIPPQDIASEFNRIIMPMIREIQKSYYETEILSNIRDTLSPKLMSGEIDVSAILF